MTEAPRLPPRQDVALAVGLGGATLAELHSSWAFEDHPEISGPGSWHYAMVLVMALALAFRRIHPLLVGPVALAVYAAAPYVAVLPNVFGLAVMALVSLYSLTLYAPSLVAAGVAGVASLALGAWQGLADETDPAGSAAAMVVWVTLVLLVGFVVRRYRERTERMRGERDAAAARARAVAAQERARIARELHDVVAHGMSVVVLQARGGRRVLGHDVAQARGAFDDIERVAAECLDEMRRLLGILRSGQDAPAALAPQPQLDELEALVAQARASGAEVELAVLGQRRALAPALELTAYRIGQEALTNALKHAPGSRTRMLVHYEDDAVTIEVVDDGPGAALNGHGHGLIGARERVEMFGGQFRAGAGPDGGFLVAARLPVTRPGGSAP